MRTGWFTQRSRRVTRHSDINDCLITKFNLQVCEQKRTFFSLNRINVTYCCMFTFPYAIWYAAEYWSTLIEYPKICLYPHINIMNFPNTERSHVLRKCNWRIVYSIHFQAAGAHGGTFQCMCDVCASSVWIFVHRSRSAFHRVCYLFISIWLAHDYWVKHSNEHT